MSTTTTSVKAEANRAARSRPMEILARLGLATRGVLYLIVAIVVVEIVRTRGTEEDEASNRGALEVVIEQPFGRALLVIVAIGVAGYALWRFAEAWLGHDDKLPKRLANVARGVIYVFLFITTISLLRGSSSSQGGGQSGSGDQQVDTILDWPGGGWIVGAIAAGVLGIAVYSVYRAASGKWSKHLELGGVSATTETVITGIAWIGLIGRAIAFGLVGWFLARAAIQFDPNEPVGLDQSLRRISIESWGPALLVITAIGLAGYGLFSFVEARWRRVLD